ncbi:hypothetical protein [Streptomyces chrestomyceticus]|uniref:hypothetical protein n=1 Tax=Streptomyces chrestomyceticus TaxID=68185 RepID=UPI0019D25340|nr:hypothetical protein [Streptomyces chrestomyceticus]
MNRNTLRMSAATVMAAVTFGIAAPAAIATEASSPSASQTLSAPQARQLLALPEISAELGQEGRAAVKAVADGTASDAQTRGAASNAAKALINLIKKQGGAFFKKAVDAAKKGTASFKKWAEGLPWYHPVRLAVAASGADVLDWIVKQIIG